MRIRARLTGPRGDGPANIGYARCSTLAQDLTAQRHALAGLGVPDDRVYLDKGLTGTSRARPGLDQALAAVREGDTFTVTNSTGWPGRYPTRSRSSASCRPAASCSRSAARSTTGTTPSAACSCNPRRHRRIRGQPHPPAHPRGHGHRPPERQARGKQPTLKPAQDSEIRRMHDSGDYNIVGIAALFNVSRPIVYRPWNARPPCPRFPLTPARA